MLRRIAHKAIWTQTYVGPKRTPGDALPPAVTPLLFIGAAHADHGDHWPTDRRLRMLDGRRHEWEEPALAPNDRRLMLPALVKIALINKKFRLIS